MSPSYIDAFNELNTLISDTEHHREKECRKFIPMALDLFVHYSGSTTILDDETEYPGHTGPSDLIIFCERTCGGFSEKYAYIWEVKSPQTIVFVQDTENRVKPSPEFVQAENQLLHYWDDCKTERFCDNFWLSNIDSILLGGILIGQESTLVKGEYEEAKKKRLYKTALNLRKQCLYGRFGIQVMIWNDVLDFLKPVKSITEDKKGNVGPVPLSGSNLSKVGSSDHSI